MTAIVAMYAGATSTRPARIKIRWADPAGKPVVVRWDSGLSVSDNYDLAAQQFMKLKELQGTWVRGSTDAGFVYCQMPGTKGPFRIV